MQSVFIYSQNPSYFVLGKSELENADIYSILQTKNKKLFVSTNKGLYEYKHGKMELLSNAEKQKGVSVFGLISNSKNEVFCFNLSGQIFKIKNRKLRFYLQIPQKYLGSAISMIFDDQDNLIVGSRGCFIIRNNKIKELYYSKDNSIITISKLIDNRIVLIENNTDFVMILNDDEFEYSKVLLSSGSTYSRDAFLINDKIVNSSMLDAQLTDKGIISYKNFNYEYIQLSKNEILGRPSSNGIDVIDVINDSLSVRKSYFKNTFISKIAVGENGLIFLGTFGNGLYVIPNKDSETYPLEGYGKNMTGIAVDDNENIFISDRTDGIIHIKEKISQLEKKINFVPEKIFIIKTNNAFINDKYPSLFYNKSLVEGSVKDIYTVDSTTILLATSAGLRKLGNTSVGNQNDWLAFSNKPNAYYYTNLKERCVSVVYDKENSSIYYASVSGLWNLKSDSIKEEITFDGKSIVVNDLLLHKGILWCATQNLGVLGYQNGKLTHQMSVGNKVESHFVNKIEEKNDTLYVSHKEGFKILDLNTLKTKTLGTAEGVIDGSVRDFAIGKGKLWHISNNQLFSTSTKTITSETPNFNLHIDSLLIENKRVHLKQKAIFSHKENQLRCYVSFLGIPYEKESVLKYKLNGFDDTWHSVDINTNIINYDFLPSGDYQLEIIAVYRDFVSKPIGYSFEIKKAFWLNWWFLLIVLLSIISLLTFFFTKRTKRIKKNASEKIERQQLKANLVELELKAMRSQMNPHFIFNAINSIQDLILQEDTDASYDYIVLFSDLVRNTLHYSNENFIPLEKEIKFLETYLKLEALRFDESFSYKINYENLKDISIPSLILQPFVENAIIHGLFHKEGTKELKISFRPKEKYLECIIEDNGIGRKKALAINTKKSPRHKSFALEAIEKRLKILQNKYGEKIGYSIIDLQEHTQATGTQVCIILPFLD